MIMIIIIIIIIIIIEIITIMIIIIVIKVCIVSFPHGAQGCFTDAVEKEHNKDMYSWCDNIIYFTTNDN